MRYRTVEQQEQPITRRASYVQQRQEQHEERRTTQLPETHPKRGSLLSCIGCAGVVVILLLLLWYAVIVPWWTNQVDQYNYGTSRITKLSANVGHGNSDFIAFDQKCQIVVIEFIEDHPDRTHIFTGINLIGDPGNRIVTLTLSDVNGDGKPDVVIHVEGDPNPKWYPRPDPRPDEQHPHRTARWYVVGVIAPQSVWDDEV